MASVKANNWSSETSSTHFKDLQATVLALRCTGEHLLLGGRRYLAILNADERPHVIKKMPRQSKFDLTAAEWNPHLSHSHFFALACNQRPEVYTFEREQLIPNHTLKQHTRTVTGLAWHRFEPTMLATCSVDTYVHIWDLRDPRKPSTSVQSIVGTSQIQWNKVNGPVFATIHDNVIQIWDHRKPTAPTQYITAHLSKIYCLDWSPTSENHIVTGSMDASARIFDVTASRQYERIIETGAPVWKTHYTPFSDAVITLSIPMMRRGETKLDLWSSVDSKRSVHSFIGLNDAVYDFSVGKIPGKGVKDHQLICWCKDQTLKTWIIDSQVKAACGFEGSDSEVADSEPDLDQPIEIMCNHEALEAEVDTVCEQVDDISDIKEMEVAPKAESFEPTVASSVQSLVSVTPSMIRSRLSERDFSSTPNAQPKTLQQEFSLINSSIDENLQIEELDSLNRFCRVRASCGFGKHQVVLEIHFPASYPYSAPPTFQFCQGSTEEPVLRSRILKGMKETALQKMKRNLSCLEPCLRHLVTILEQASDRTENDQSGLRSSLTLEDLENVSVGRRDMSVPYPRSSGARFCSAGMLVCFGRPSYSKRISTNSVTELKTPRSLSTKQDMMNKRAPSLESQYGFPMPPVAQSPTGDPSSSVSYFFYQDRRSKTRSRVRLPIDEKKPNEEANKKKAKVTIYDASRLMPLQKDFAEKYCLDDKNVSASCLQNALAAAQLGRRDLHHVWTMASVMTSPSLLPNRSMDAGMPWAQHPGGRKLVSNIIDHYIKLYDIQTAAMLCCVFGTKTEPPQHHRVKNVSISSHSSHSVLKGRWGYKAGESTYHTVHPSDTTLEGWNYGQVIKHSRSNSWSESFDEIKPSLATQMLTSSQSQHERNSRLLDPEKSHLYDSVRRVYAEILYRWEMAEQRADVLKYQSTPPESHVGIDFYLECNTCKGTLKDAFCRRCNQTGLKCGKCNLGVRGISVFCLACGHGGHPEHMKEWFSEFDICATGCGCACKRESPSVICP